LVARNAVFLGRKVISAVVEGELAGDLVAARSQDDAVAGHGTVNG